MKNKPSYIFQHGLPWTHYINQWLPSSSIHQPLGLKGGPTRLESKNNLPSEVWEQEYNRD